MDKKLVTFTIDAQLFKEFKIVALKKDLSVSEMLRNYIENEVKFDDERTERLKKIRENSDPNVTF